MQNWLTPGMRLMLLGTFLFSMGSLCIKLAGERMPTMEILFVRGIVGMFFCWVVVRRSGVGVFGKRRFMLALRGLTGFIALFGEFYAIVHLPLADATVILFSHPVMVAILAWAVMGEKLKLQGLAAILVCLTGVAAVCRPGFLTGVTGPPLDPLAIGVALGAVCFISIAILSVRSLAKTEHPAVVMFYPPLIISLAAPLFAEGWVVPTAPEWAMVLGVAVFMNVGQYYMTRGFALESAARVSAVSCLEIVFAAFWGALFLGEIPDAWTIAGGLLIVIGTLALGRSAQDETPTPAQAE